MELDEMITVFNLADRESKFAERAENKRWEIFMRFICGQPMKMSDQIRPENFGFELQEMNPGERVVCFQRDKLILVISESFADGISYCECKWDKSEL